MDQEQFFTTLQAHLDGLLYFSESEAPLLSEKLGPLGEEELRAKIAMQNDKDPQSLSSIDPAAFFSDILNQADPGDRVIMENAQKFGELYTFLKNNCSNLQVFRLEGGTRVPIIITAVLPDQDTLSLSTYAIES